MSCTKSKCDRYDIRAKDGYGWAIILIDEKAGLFSTVSDYGNYGYIWTHHGCKSIKEFLLGMEKDPYYFMNKLAQGERIFDAKETFKECGEAVIKARRADTITKEQARECFDFLKDLMDDVDNDKTAYHYRIIECKVLMDEVFGESWEYIPYRERFSYQLEGFFRDIVPELMEVLKAELNESAN